MIVVWLLLVSLCAFGAGWNAAMLRVLTEVISPWLNELRPDAPHFWHSMRLYDRANARLDAIRMFRRSSAPRFDEQIEKRISA